MPDASSLPPREIKDENGDLLYRVREENPGTMFRALICEGPRDNRRVTEYPELWRRLSDMKLYKVCLSGEPIGP